MTAGFYGMLQGKPAVIDRRYSRKARVDGIEFVNELPTQDTSVRRSLSRAEGVFPEVVNSVLDGQPGTIIKTSAPIQPAADD